MPGKKNRRKWKQRKEVRVTETFGVGDRSGCGAASEIGVRQGLFQDHDRQRQTLTRHTEKKIRSHCTLWDVLLVDYVQNSW